ncbi:MAG: hypothetical protein WCM76_06620 [Bacteroidota bacterium]
MGRIIVLDEDDLRRIFKEVLAESRISPDTIENIVGQEELLTSLGAIAKLFHCSLPTAQKIKNTIPKNLYRQYGKTFAIPRNVLLDANADLRKSKSNMY